ncbi:MAG: Crp/Fnr family transcriptional regulator, partial [Myxococcota bacterium]
SPILAKPSRDLPWPAMGWLVAKIEPRGEISALGSRFVPIHLFVNLLKRPLKSHPLLGLLSFEGIERIRNQGRAVFLEPGERLYTASEPANRVFALLEGAIQIEYPAPGEIRGRAVTMLSAPSMLGECQVLNGRSWSGTGVALAPVTALGLGRELLESLVLDEPRFALALYRELSERFLHAIDSWKTTPARDPSQTLARYLIAYCHVSESDGHVPLRQAALGQATGLRRETVNRLLKRWERDGLVELSARGLEIDNVAQFSARWADSDEWVGPALNGNPVPRPMSATAEESPQSALLA